MSPRYPGKRPRPRAQTEEAAHQGGRERHFERDSEPQIVFGVEPVKDPPAAAPATIRTLHVRERDRARFADEIERTRTSGGEVQLVDDAALARVAGREA